MVPKSSADAEAPVRRAILRRRRLFVGLLIAAGSSLLVGLLPGQGHLLLLHLAFDSMIAGYVIHLLQVKQRKPAKRSLNSGSAPSWESQDEELSEPERRHA